jgi:hypothetical protein
MHVFEELVNISKHVQTGLGKSIELLVLYHNQTLHPSMHKPYVTNQRILQSDLSMGGIK